MIVRVITVSVKLDQIDAWERATRANHEGSIAEPGVARFDVLKSENTPGEYVLYEMYRSPEAALLHKETGHYKEWKASVEPMMAKPREGLAFDLLFPSDE